MYSSKEWTKLAIKNKIRSFTTLLMDTRQCLPTIMNMLMAILAKKV